MIYKVIGIYEADFGCEGAPDALEVMAEVVLEDNSGDRKTIVYPDSKLYSDDINEGDIVKLENNIIIKP